MLFLPVVTKKNSSPLPIYSFFQWNYVETQYIELIKTALFY